MTTSDGIDTPHESRLAKALRELLHTQRVASLATLDPEGQAFVSMVPFAIEPTEGVLVIHISGLAAHTGHLAKHPLCTALIMKPELDGHPVHALPRVTLALEAHPLAVEDDTYSACRAAYLARFPEANHMTALPDFRFVALHVRSARQVAGFGAARSVDTAELEQALRNPATPGVLH